MLHSHHATGTAKKKPWLLTRGDGDVHDVGQVDLLVLADRVPGAPLAQLLLESLDLTAQPAVLVALALVASLPFLGCQLLVHGHRVLDRFRPVGRGGGS